MPHAQERSKREALCASCDGGMFSAKRNGGMTQVFPRHCERSEAIQSLSADGFWIASLRSQ
jgi:hypothetical protein